MDGRKRAHQYPKQVYSHTAMKSENEDTVWTIL